MEKEVRLIDANALLKKTLIPPGNVVLVDDIDNAPTIEAKPVIHAHWLPGPGEWKECSHCHEEEFLPDLQHSNYCPNCGATMDAE